MWLVIFVNFFLIEPASWQHLNLFDNYFQKEHKELNLNIVLLKGRAWEKTKPPDEQKMKLVGDNPVENQLTCYTSL